MKKLQLILILFVFSTVKIKAQNNISGILEVNYNSFSQNNLKDFQNQLKNEITEVNLSVNDEFGSNIGYTVGVQVESLKAQFFLSYNTTGGKISYSDFSGSIRLTQLLEAYSLGSEYQLRLSDENRNDTFYLGLRGIINFSSMELESYSNILGNESGQVVKFNSVDFGLGARLTYDIPIYVFKLRLNIGYDLMFGGQLRFSENSDFYLENDRGEEVKTNWSGFRSGIGLVIPF